MARRSIGLIIGLLVWAGFASAQVVDEFTVRDFPVAVTAADGAAARDQALAAGPLQAWDFLLDQIVPYAQQASRPELDPALVDSLVQSIDVTDEQLTSTRFRALLTVNFRPNAMRQWLRDNGLDYTIISTQTLVVVPIVVDAAGAYTVAANTAWWQAWRGLPAQGASMVLRLPLLDATDRQWLAPASLATPAAASLQALRARYNGDAVVFVYAALGAAATDPLTVEVLEPLADGSLRRVSQTYFNHARQALPDFMRIAAMATARGLVTTPNAITAAGAETPLPQVKQIPVVARYPNHGVWLRIRRALVGAPGVTAARPVVVTNAVAQYNLTLRGEPSELAAVLQRQGLNAGVEFNTVVIDETSRP